MRKLHAFAEFARQVTYFMDMAADYGSDFVLLPELFSVQLLSHFDAVPPQEGIQKLAELRQRFKALMHDLVPRRDHHHRRQPSVFGRRPLQNNAHVCLPDGS